MEDRIPGGEGRIDGVAADPLHVPALVERGAPHHAQFSRTDRKAAPDRRDPEGQCHTPHLLSAARMTVRSPAARRGRRFPVVKSERAARDQSRPPPEVSSFPVILRRGELFHSRRKPFAAALCPRVRLQLASATRVRHAAVPPPGNQGRRCRRKQSLVIRGKKLSAFSRQLVAPASRPRGGAALRNSCRFCCKRCRDGLCWFTLHARTQQLSFNAQSVQKLRVSWPVLFSFRERMAESGELFPRRLTPDDGRLKPDQQRGTSLGAGCLGHNQQHRGCGFNRTLETKPGSQRHAPCRRVRHIAEVDRHQAKASALQKQIGDPQCLLE